MMDEQRIQGASWWEHAVRSAFVAGTMFGAGADEVDEDDGPVTTTEEAAEEYVGACRANLIGFSPEETAMSSENDVEKRMISVGSCPACGGLVQHVGEDGKSDRRVDLSVEKLRRRDEDWLEALDRMTEYLLTHGIEELRRALPTGPLREEQRIEGWAKKENSGMPGFGDFWSLYTQTRPAWGPRRRAALILFSAPTDTAGDQP